MGIGSGVGKLFTDKLVYGWLDVFGGWWRDSSTPANAYLANDSCLPLLLQMLRFILTTKVACKPFNYSMKD
jgi:hypothetical protein